MICTECYNNGRMFELVITAANDMLRVVGADVIRSSFSISGHCWLFAAEFLPLLQEKGNLNHTTRTHPNFSVIRECCNLL